MGSNQSSTCDINPKEDTDKDIFEKGYEVFRFVWESLILSDCHKIEVEMSELKDLDMGGLTMNGVVLTKFDIRLITKMVDGGEISMDQVKFLANQLKEENKLLRKRKIRTR